MEKNVRPFELFGSFTKLIYQTYLSLSKKYLPPPLSTGSCQQLPTVGHYQTQVHLGQSTAQSAAASTLLSAQEVWDKISIFDQCVLV